MIGSRLHIAGNDWSLSANGVLIIPLGLGVRPSGRF